MKDTFMRNMFTMTFTKATQYSSMLYGFVLQPSPFIENSPHGFKPFPLWPQSNAITVSYHNIVKAHFIRTQSTTVKKDLL